jgi:ribose transport system ATP-binding protein
MQGTRLRLDGVSKSFGATHALRAVSLEVAAGEVHALIGENGAGKSTLLKILSGAHPADAGRMVLDGAPFRPSGPMEARRLGVAMIYQEVNLARHLSVRENILLGSESSTLGWIDEAESRRRAQEALAGLGYGHFPLERPAGEFSIAEQQVIEIARALLLQPRVLIMDEPTSSLTKSDTEKLFGVIQAPDPGGQHHLREPLPRGVPPHLRPVHGAEGRRDRGLRRNGRGGDGKDGGPHDGPPGLRPLSQDFAENGAGRPRGALARPGAAAHRAASLSVHEGEIFGLAGLIGAGRTDLVRAIFGLDRADSGEVAVVGRPAGRPTPAAAGRRASAS